jgi:hypothetical protein
VEQRQRHGGSEVGPAFFALAPSGLLANDGKRSAAVWAEAKDGKVVIEGSRALDPKTAHHRETCSVDDREILVTIRDADLPGGFQIRCADCLYNRHAVAQALPEPFGGTAADSMPDQRPRFDQDMIANPCKGHSFGWRAAGYDHMDVSTKRLILHELSATRLDAS